MIKIAFLGISHLSLNYAAAAIYKKCKVVIFDTNKKLIKKYSEMNVEIFEPKLTNIIKKNKSRIKFSSNFKDLKKFNIIFVSKDVPTNSKGKSDYKEINYLIKKAQINSKKSSNLVVMSQVHPGFCENIKWDKKKLYYFVETLIFGKAFDRASKPERIIIGKYDTKKNIDLEFKKYLNLYKCPKILMNLRSAELTKISINILLILSITGSNILSEICEKIGANWKIIRQALYLDKRIGKKAYIEPGLGISGGNLERDLKTISGFSNFRREYKNFFNNLDKISKIRKKWISDQLIKNCKIDGKTKIFLLGLTYKKETNSIKNSPSIELLKFLYKKFGKKYLQNIFIYDPKVQKINVNKTIKESNDLNFGLSYSKIVVIMTPWSIFGSLKYNKYKSIKYIIDPFDVLKSKKFKNIKIIKMGVNETR